MNQTSRATLLHLLLLSALQACTDQTHQKPASPPNPTPAEFFENTGTFNTLKECNSACPAHMECFTPCLLCPVHCGKTCSSDDECGPDYNCSCGNTNCTGIRSSHERPNICVHKNSVSRILN